MRTLTYIQTNIQTYNYQNIMQKNHKALLPGVNHMVQSAEWHCEGFWWL